MRYGAASPIARCETPAANACCFRSARKRSKFAPLWQLAARGTGAARAGAGKPGAVTCAQAAFPSIARLTVTSRGLENIRMGYRSEANFDVLSTTISKTRQRLTNPER